MSAAKSYCVYLPAAQHSRLMECLRLIRRDLEDQGVNKSYCAIARDLLLEAAENAVEEIRLMTTPLGPRITAPTLDDLAFRESLLDELKALAGAAP